LVGRRLAGHGECLAHPTDPEEVRRLVRVTARARARARVRARARARARVRLRLRASP